MDIEALHNFVMELDGTEETMPFGDEAVVYKIEGKMFLLISLKQPFRTTLKCDPDLGEQLIEAHPDDIQPGYHMNKKHWLTLNMAGNLSESFFKERVIHSRNLVIQKLPGKVRQKYVV